MERRNHLASTAIEDFDNGDFLMATKILTSRIKLEPTNHELYLERSVCHHKLGDYRASLEDANAAIKLNSTDHNIHYQKGLALIGLSMFPEAISTFKKAIELRAKQEDSKLSDIFNLLKCAIVELKSARCQQETRACDVAIPASSSSNQPNNMKLGTSGEPVDSTTDIKLSKSNTVTSHQSNNLLSIAKPMNKDNTNLVALPNCNNQSPYASSGVNQTFQSSNVSSSATYCNGNDNSSNGGVMLQRDQTNLLVKPNHHQANISGGLEKNNHDCIVDDQGKNSQFEWNIRRSERIFLHNINEPGASSPQLGSDHQGSKIMIKQKTNSNSSSVCSGRGQNKRMHEASVESIHSNNNINMKNNNSKSANTNPCVDSDVDVDNDSSEHQSSIILNRNLTSNGQQKRVMVVPSSSMPATSQIATPPTSATKDDSYSSKYKRLRRDRERARRGTSKVCTIKPSDLEELQQHASSGSGKNSMRVIAPIDGWLYSGQLSVDDSPSEDSSRSLHYVVKLDGDSSGSSYLFTQDTVLNDVIKEVRVKSVSDLRKGARICCYWSRTYKCLSTGVVTSRTFEATKSLVSVKYDNGDLSALPLEDLRLLPPDYPKYMSNCDPLLLARNSDGTTVPSLGPANQIDASRVVVAPKLTSEPNNDVPSDVSIVKSSHMELTPPEQHEPEEFDERISRAKDSPSQPQISFQPLDQDDTTDDEEVIPPTNEAIDFITNDTLGAELHGDDNDTDLGAERTSETIEGDSSTNESQTTVTDSSRISSEENSFGIEYRPWVFEGSPKRSKRHGRTYRDSYTAIRRGNEVLRIGDSAELMPRDSSILPFIAKIDGLWSTGRGEMRVRVRWYYRLVETEGDSYNLKDGENALFETDHFDENDIQSIWRSTKILSWTDYSRDHIGHTNKQSEGPKVFYLAGYYDPVRRIKHLRSDVKEVQ